MGKIMDAIIAKRMEYMAKAHQLLPNMHIKGRKQRSTEHALHITVNRIYRTWNSGQKAASALLLDVSGAFDNVSHARLLHNLKNKGINEKTVKWIGSFLYDRYTRVVINGYTLKEYETATGIPQNSLLSFILYLFYNADLVESCNTDAIMAIRYINDVAIMATGNTTKKSCEKLATALTTANQWAQKHASIFAPEKFQLIHFTRSKITNINQMLSIT
jgi:hypothetical protein